MANEYCTRADLYRYGMPRGMLGGSARLVASVTAATDVIELDDHSFETDDAIVFRAAEGGTMPSPLVEGTTYYAIRVDGGRFKVAATAGGAAINITSAGESVFVAIDPPVMQVIEFYSRWVDTFMPAHAVPFTSGSIPALIVGIVAQLAAKQLAALAGHKSAAIDEAVKAAEVQLARFAKGLPLRDSSATASTNRAHVSSYSSTDTDARGWKSGVLP